MFISKFTGQHRAREGKMHLGAFAFSSVHLALIMTDGDGLKDTQEASDADGHTPAHPVNVGKQPVGKITYMLPSKRLQCISNST